MSPEQREFIESHECFSNDLDRSTSAESHDYDFENCNRNLKVILCKDPTFDDFRKST